jgi:hypothetical protein
VVVGGDGWVIERRLKTVKLVCLTTWMKEDGRRLSMASAHGGRWKLVKDLL